MKITLSSEKPSITFNLEAENRFFKITDIYFPPEENQFTRNDIESSSIILKFSLVGKEEQLIEAKVFPSISAIISPQQKDSHYKVDRILCDSTSYQYDTLELIIEFPKDWDVNMEISYDNRNLISMVDPWGKFKRHLEDPSVSKVLFSAPFGSGKTTFLNEFFSEDKNYEVFHVYPVNYSVARNEDIFKYIKAEILFQLLGLNLIFDKESISFPSALAAFAKKFPLKILRPFADLLPSIGKSIFDIADALEKLCQEFSDFKKTKTVADEKQVTTFIEHLYEEEGSIYEDNFFSQITRHLLLQLKQNTGRQNVLIIDDTDRMDPEHIFRILNVLAAHFDTPSCQSLEIANKFGFDKIIVVCDYDNLRKIFAHRFGPKTDFAGYIDKFFSKEVFYYDNITAMQTIVERIHGDNRVAQIDHFERYKLILNDLIRSKSISLREVLLLKKQDHRLIIGQNNYKSIPHGGENPEFENALCSPYINYTYFLALYYLSRICGPDHVIKLLKSCRDNIKLDSSKYASNTYDYSHLAYECFIPLSYNGSSSNDSYSINYNGYLYQFEIELDFNHRLKISPIVGNGRGNFNIKDFYNLMILVAQKYKEVGGLISANTRF